MRLFLYCFLLNEKNISAKNECIFAINNQFMKIFGLKYSKYFVTLLQKFRIIFIYNNKAINPYFRISKMYHAHIVFQ